MTWIIAVVILVIFGVMAVAFAVVMPKFKIIQNLIDRLNLTMRENLSGMLVIRAFGNEKHSEDRFDKANKDVTNLNLFVNRSKRSSLCFSLPKARITSIPDKFSRIVRFKQSIKF